MDEEEFPKSFQAKEIEKKWYAFWETRGFFKANPSSKKPAYCICIPPPNVTGVLHMGHALVDTLQDILVRFKRMSGFEVLWVPGTDHAGIATQTVVEKQLIAATGKRRKEFSREEFLSHVWAWKEKSETQILSQLKMLGCSCDWSRLAFTMDAPRNRAVMAMFKKMFDANLIYRGDYLVNWDPVTQTALADDEVEYEERAGHLWYFRYPLQNSSEFISVATTRPETLPGDTAIAVSPKDPRYTPFIGQNAIHPLTGRLIPIIADHLVDPEFGTGAVKITPAHDPNDYAMGLKHKLPMINILTDEGRMNENAGPFASLTKEEAREAIVATMKEKGCLIKAEPHTHRVGISYRSKAVIEPYLSKQWFVRMEQFKPALRKAVEESKVKLIPSNWENTYFHWIDNLRDWCISRQLWWGHRIPIWYHKDNPEQMFCSDSSEPPAQVAQAPELYVQDEDVLDTWFSSALWPFSALGWPEKSPELSKFYPNSTLITGHDILFFWVARMILMGEYALDSVPFPETFLHGLIYGRSYWREDKKGGITYVSAQERLQFDLGQPLPPDVASKWEKMSKSKGNIIDPLEIIESYGTDAMRMGLCASATHARQIDLDRRRFEEFKNFSNKIWNGARFVFLNLSTLSSSQLASGLDLDQLALEDRWILSLLGRTIEQTHVALNQYAFDKAAMTAYDFFWKEFCAYYVELVKPILSGKQGTPEDKQVKQQILSIVLCSVLRLIHPMAPFITEELFQKLKNHFVDLPSNAPSADPYTQEMLQALQAPACMVAGYPRVLRPQDINAEIETTFSFLDEVVRTVRHIRAQMQLPPSVASDLYLIAPDHSTQRALIHSHLSIVKALVKLKDVHVASAHPALSMQAQAMVGDVTLIIPLPEEYKQKEKERLAKEKVRIEADQERLRAQLANTAFLEKAPPALIEKLKTNLAQLEKELTHILQALL